MFTLLVKDLYSSYKDLPLALFQIQTKYRDEARPRAGLIRGREFIMKDAYSFDVDDEGLERSYNLQREAYQRIFDRLGPRVRHRQGDERGDGRLAQRGVPPPHARSARTPSSARPAGTPPTSRRSPTPTPEPVAFDGLPAAEVLDTPDSPTIDTLVDAANRLHPRPDRPWTAADTLKNVVLALTHPDGRREVVAVGLPGDREVDLKRLQAAVEPAEVEPATDEDLEGRAELVKGYIGPGVLGPNGARRDFDGDGRQLDGAMRYLLDPRVAPGTAWITGADADGKHVFGLVAGRDFTADGTIEAAEVREGDPAPDGSGPLELARGIEIGHIFALGRKYAAALDLKVLDQNGKAVTVTMGSYGIGVTRALAALAEANADDKGLVWPMQVAPAHVHVLATGKDQAVFEVAERLAGELEAAGVEVLYDDRPKVSAGVKFADAELLGVPLSVVVGRGLADGVVEVRRRASGEREEIAPDAAVARVRELVDEALAG